jgi:hypothetical protein
VWGDGGAYAAWTTYLQAWGTDLRTTDERLPVLGRDDFAPETWVRLTNRIIDAINARLRAWTTAVSAEISTAGSEHAVGRALVSSRVGLASILRLADHPSLPDDLRGQLRKQVEEQIASIQQSLIDDAAGLQSQGWTRSAAEARQRTVRENPLLAVLNSPAASSATGAPAADPWAFDRTQRPRRHLVID